MRSVNTAKWTSFSWCFTLAEIIMTVLTYVRHCSAGMIDDCLAQVRATNEHASKEEDHITTPIAVHVFPSGPEIFGFPSNDAAEQAVTSLSRHIQRQMVVLVAHLGNLYSNISVSCICFFGK